MLGHISSPTVTKVSAAHSHHHLHRINVANLFIHHQCNPGLSGISTISPVAFQTTWKDWKDQHWRENCSSGEESLTIWAEKKDVLWQCWRFTLGFSRTVRLYCSFVTKELLLSNPNYAFWENDTVSPLGCCQFWNCMLLKIQYKHPNWLEWVCSYSHPWLSVLGCVRAG